MRIYTKRTADVSASTVAALMPAVFTVSVGFGVVLPLKAAGELKVLLEGRERVAKVEIGERPPLRGPK